MVLATALALMVLDAAGFAPVAEARRTVVSVSDPLGRLLAFAVRPATATWHGAVHYDDLEEENRELRRQNAELAGILAGQPDAEAELAALLDATDIEFLGDVNRVTARVVADRQSDLERVVEIDKGRSDGILEGMPVATGTGLVGVVAVAAADRSVIRLLSDVETAIGVRSRYGLGLMTGTGDGPLRLEPSPELAEAIQTGRVAIGERFVTSGVDRSIYPAGIPVGSLALSFGEGGGAPPPAPAGPDRAAGGQAVTDGPAGEPIQPPQTQDPWSTAARPGPRVLPVDITLEPFAALDRLGYLTVLLVEPSR